jgi:hypothetical protein
MTDYVTGSPQDKLTLTFKIFTRKNQKRASKSHTVNTTVGELRRQSLCWWKSEPFTGGITVLNDPPGFYTGHALYIKYVMNLFDKLGADIAIPNKFHSRDAYISSIYDILLNSSRPLVFD